MGFVVHECLEGTTLATPHIPVVNLIQGDRRVLFLRIAQYNPMHIQSAFPILCSLGNSLDTCGWLLLLMFYLNQTVFGSEDKLVRSHYIYWRVAHAGKQRQMHWSHSELGNLILLYAFISILKKPRLLIKPLRGAWVTWIATHTALGITLLLAVPDLLVFL